MNMDIWKRILLQVFFGCSVSVVSVGLSDRLLDLFKIASSMDYSMCVVDFYF